MQFTTEHSIGDKVYFKNGLSVKEITISKIEVTIYKGSQFEEYNGYRDVKMSKTKQEVNTLIKEFYIEKQEKIQQEIDKLSI